MRQRPASRLLVVDPEPRVLLFRFSFARGALAGQDCWATPGGGVEPGETFEKAARRELAEETGLAVDDIGPEVARRSFAMVLMDGETVEADERFFLVEVADAFLPSREGWTEDEVAAVSDHRWWTLDELDRRSVQVWPEDVAGIVRAALGRVPRSAPDAPDTLFNAPRSA